MSDSSYKGDSPGKKVTRLRLWLHIRAVCNALNIPYTGTLVLAGEGGDLSVLKGMGTDLSTVVAVDRDPFLIEWCSELYPEVITFACEAADMAEAADYNIAHLDFCGGLRNPVHITAFSKVAAHLHSHPGLIAVTLQKCREGIAASSLLAGVSPEAQRELLQEATARQDPVGCHIFRGNRFDSRFVIRHSEARMRRLIKVSPATVARGFYTTKGKLGNLGHAMVRADAMRWCSEWLMKAWRSTLEQEPIVLRLIGAYTYHSETRYRPGQPFFTALFAVAPVSQEQAVMQALKKVNVQRFDSWDKKTSLEGLKPTALDLLKHIPDAQVAQMLDIPPVRVRDWKAEGSKRQPLFTVDSLLEFPGLGFRFKRDG